MARIPESVPPYQAIKLTLCRYINATNKVQIVRIKNIPNWYFERVVFPGQCLNFEAMQEAQLEVHTGIMASAILSDCIPCEQLWVHAAVDMPTKVGHEQVVSKTPLRPKIHSSTAT